MDTQSTPTEIHLTAENVINTDAQDLTKVPEPPKPLTRADIGKLRRSVYYRGSWNR